MVVLHYGCIQTCHIKSHHKSDCNPSCFPGYMQSGSALLQSRGWRWCTWRCQRLAAALVTTVTACRTRQTFYHLHRLPFVLLSRPHRSISDWTDQGSNKHDINAPIGRFCMILCGEIVTLLRQEEREQLISMYFPCNFRCHYHRGQTL